MSSMIRLKLCFLFFLFVTSCQNQPNEVGIDEFFDHYFRNLHTIQDKKHLENLLFDVNEKLTILETENSPYVWDIKYLKKLFEGKILTRTMDDPNLGFLYLNVALSEQISDDLRKQYQKAAPKCLVFDPTKDNAQLEMAFNNLKNETFTANNRTYHFSDAIQEWMGVKGFADENIAKKKLGARLKGGICKGIQEFSNKAFCEDTRIGEHELSLSLDNNFISVITDQLKSNILSDLSDSKKHIFPSAYNAYYEKHFPIIHVLKGFMPSTTVKKYIQNQILKKPNTAKAINVSFRSGNPHAVSLQITPKIFRIIDNNVGILVFNDEDKFLDAFSTYLVTYYGDRVRPETVFFIKECI